MGGLALGPIGSADAEGLEGLNELLGVVVTRTEDGRVERVSVPCVDFSELDVRDLGAGRGDPEPEDRVRAVLDALVRLDPQQADDLRARLERLLGSRRFSPEPLRSWLVESAAWSSEDAILAHLQAEEPAGALGEDAALEPISARVRDAGTAEDAVVIDEALWVELTHGEQASVMILQLAAAERQANHGAGPHPCAQLAAFATFGQADLSLATYLETLGAWRSPSRAGATVVEPGDRRPARADLFFRPLDRPRRQDEAPRVQGYRIRKLGVIDWGVRTDLGISQEETTSTFGGGNSSTTSELLYRAFVGVDFDGYVYHPQLLRFGITAAILAEWGALDIDGNEQPRDSVSPQIGITGLALGARKVSYRFAYNKYRSDRQQASDNYTITDVDSWRLGVLVKYPLVPFTLDVGQSGVDERERTSLRQRREDEFFLDLHATNTLGPSHTTLDYAYRDEHELRVHVNGGVRAYDRMRETHAGTLRNRWALKALDTQLHTWAQYRGESGDRDLESWTVRQDLPLVHGPKLSSDHDWSWSSRRLADQGEPIEGSSLSARSAVRWDVAERFQLSGEMSYRADDLDDFSRSELGGLVTGRWSRAWARADLTAWGEIGSTWGDESGRSGLAVVTGELVTLSGQSPALLDNPDVQEDSVLVRSEDGTTTYEPDVDYRTTPQGDLLEIVRLETGTIHDGATVRVDYVHLVELTAPLSYRRDQLRAGVTLRLFDRAHLYARWESLGTTVDAKDEEAADAARFDPQELLELGGDWTLGPCRLRIQHQDSRRPGNAATSDRLAVEFARAFTPIHTLRAGAAWLMTDFEAGEDLEEWWLHVDYAWNPQRRWPRVTLRASYRPYERDTYDGAPWEVDLEIQRDYSLLDLLIRASWSVRDDESSHRERSEFEVLLRRVW